jgi:hypothetical protein
METDNAAGIRLNAMLGNCIFYISPMYLRRQRPGRLRLLSADRLLWAWLYRIWPQVINAMVLVKPVTVVQWHRKGFRL